VHRYEIPSLSTQCITRSSGGSYYCRVPGYIFLELSIFKRLTGTVALLLATHAKRVTVQQIDMKLAKKIRVNHMGGKIGYSGGVDKQLLP
jgi:hypothetical protein